MQCVRRIAIVLLSLWLCAAAVAQQPRANIGYAYPAGGQRGTTIAIIVGGQGINQPTDVYISGSGITATVGHFLRPPKNLNQEQRWLVTNALMTAWLARLKDQGCKEAKLEQTRADMLMSEPWRILAKTDIDTTGEKMPQHPFLIGLEKKSLSQLLDISQRVFFPAGKQQLNRQLDEMVSISVKIDRNAMPGRRELRLRTKDGLSNPIGFYVGDLPEAFELEPNDNEANDMPQSRQYLQEFIKPTIHAIPIVLNGTIMPGDQDRFRFRARRDQHLVIDVAARRLIPYLADAVPGWFQAVVTLYDSNGRELAYVDDYRSHPDPVLSFEVPADGEYEVGIRDAIYRGRDDFIYRITISEQPYITTLFPLGGRIGSTTAAALDGWNLTGKRASLDLHAGPGGFRTLSVGDSRQTSNAVSYAVDDLPERTETEPNETLARAESITMPVIINGRIDKPADVDVFQIRGRIDETLVVEVTARQLDSPLDSLVRVLDSSGKVLEWNDDYVVKAKQLHMDRLGLTTHHADSYLLMKLPKTGAFFVQISDAQHHGGPEYAYRLRMSLAQPDFDLRVTPSSIYARPGAHVPIQVHVLRRDGFDGEIEINISDSKNGFAVSSSNVIPVGSTSMWMTIIAPNTASPQPLDLKLEGIGRTGTSKIRRTATAADDVMQAFLYEHLVPAEQLMCIVREQKWSEPAIAVARPGAIRLRPGQSTTIRFEAESLRTADDLTAKLKYGPEGLAVGERVHKTTSGLEIDIELARDAKCSGFIGNIIVELYREQNADKDSKTDKKKSSWPIGYLPAIPIEVITTADTRN